MTRFEPGDRVMAVVAGGGQAELAVVHERAAMPVPEELDWTAAGGVPEAFTTAHDALFTQARLTRRRAVLVHGAAGGVGMAAVQLATMAGARVTATVRDAARASRSPRSACWRSSPTGFEAHGPFDVILELVGAPNLAGEPAGARRVRADLRDRRRRRRQGGAQPARADGQARADPRLGPARRARSRTRRTPRGASSAPCCPGFASGDLSVPVAATFPLDAVADAYARFAAGAKLGKIVLEIG